MKVIKIKATDITKVEWNFCLGLVWIKYDGEEYEVDIDDVEGDLMKHDSGFSFVFRSSRNTYKFIVE